jgi:RimJ/RimL family protein N-acetyltransferase
LRALTSDAYDEMPEAEIDATILKHLKDPLYHDFIILAEKKPVGHILIHKKSNKKNFELYIAIGEKDYWGKGVGTEVVNLACSWFWTNFLGEEVIELEVNQDNPRAIRCYEKAGFAITGKKSYKNSKDTYKMEKRKP